MDNTTRFTRLLGECRRQMNGAVAGSMRYYGEPYGLNYGVSIPTVRSLAQGEGKEHIFATYLYLQQVREIRLASLHIAQAEMIEAADLDFWAAGIINSEVAEEAAFALFQYVECVVNWLDDSNELLVYTALLSISKSCCCDIDMILHRVALAIQRESMLLTSASVTLLERYYREPQNRVAIDQFISQKSCDHSFDHLREELEWRCEAYRE